MKQSVPTLAEFLSYCRETLKYLEEYGFKEISPPPYRNTNPFELWFKADKRIVIVTGDSWGTSASIYLEHEDGFELAEIYFVPENKRPIRKDMKVTTLTQLEQVSRSAKWLQEHGADFLEGDLTRFFEYARLLPPYKSSK